MYIKQAYMLFLLAILLFKNTSYAQEKLTAKQPNIIFIMADDLGYGNITCYNPNSRIPTPHIDKMAKEGIRFTRFYAGSTVCAPSRSALMTGLHLGHTYIRGNANVPLRPQDTTLAQRLQANGYATGMFGKWGLGMEEDSGAPHLKGFDEFFGYLNQRHAHHYYTDRLWEVKNRKLQKVPMDTTRYTHDLIMERAISFIRDNQNEPFFLYLPITIPHAELRIPEKDMEAFRNKDGSSKFPPETPYVQKPSTSYRTQDQPHVAFAAMITKMDQSVGQVLALLKELGLDENTYVFFTSDNGPHKEGGADPEYFNSSGSLRGVKRDLYEGGIRVPMLVRAPGKVPAGKTSAEIWAGWDILPTVCELTATPVPANIDGLSFNAAISGKKQQQKHDYLYWQFNEGMYKEAVVQGNWKLVRLKEKNKPEVLELYNLGSDISERKNISAANSAKVKELKILMGKSKTPAEHPKFDWSAIEL